MLDMELDNKIEILSQIKSKKITSRSRGNYKNTLDSVYILK